MEGQGSIHLGIFQDARLHHSGSPLEALLPRLEHQLYLAGKLLLVGLQQPGRPQQHGGVDIVSAGVGVAPFGGKGQAALLLHLQGVHIPPQEEDLSSLLPDAGGDAPCQPPGPQAQGLQLPADKFGGPGQLHPQLRHLVEGAAASYQLLLEPLGLLVKSSHLQHGVFTPFLGHLDPFGAVLAPF